LYYSREFLLTYERFTYDPDIVNLINQLINDGPRHPAIKVLRTPERPDLRPPYPAQHTKTYPKTKIHQNGKLDKTSQPVKSHPQSLLTPPGITIPPDLLENYFFLYKSNSVPSTIHYDQIKTPKKLASSPILSPYPKLFSPHTPVILDPNPNYLDFGESKFTSLFSQNDSADISSEINLKPYLSFDFIEDSPRSPPKTPPVKQFLSPIRSVSKSSQKSPRSRPVSPLDEQRLIQRQKQIDYGYRTVGYLRYRLLVPKESRKSDHPRTPKKAQGCSKRSWDGQLKKWRRDLHLWDPDNLENFRAFLSSQVVQTLVFTNPELEDIVRVVREKLDNPNFQLKHTEDEEDESTEDLSSYSPSFFYQKSPADNPSPNTLKVARTLIF